MNFVDLIKNVITSWQVIAVTLAILFYFFIVTQAAKTYRRPSALKNLKAKFKKKEKPSEPAAGPEVTESDSHVDELGIEEA